MRSAERRDVLLLAALLVALPLAATITGSPLLHLLDGFYRAGAVINGPLTGWIGGLAAALIDPVFTSSVHSLADAGLALACLGLLMLARLSPVWVVGFAALAGQLLTL